MDNKDLNQPAQPNQQTSVEPIVEQQITEDITAASIDNPPVFDQPIVVPAPTSDYSPAQITQTDIGSPSFGTPATEILSQPSSAAASAEIDSPIVTEKPKKTASSKIKFLIIGLIIVLLAVGGFFGYKFFFADNSKTAADNRAL